MAVIQEPSPPISNPLALAYPNPNWVTNLESIASSSPETPQTWSCFARYLEQVSSYNSTQTTSQTIEATSTSSYSSVSSSESTASIPSSPCSEMETPIERKRRMWREAAQRKKERDLKSNKEVNVEERRRKWREASRRRLEKLRLLREMNATASTSNRKINQTPQNKDKKKSTRTRR